MLELAVRTLSLLTLTSALALVGATAVAQGYPARSIRIIVGAAPGGGLELVGRPIAQRLSEVLGQPVLFENKPGANGNVGADEVVRAAPDGHTLLLSSTSQLTINPALYASMPFDSIRDLAPIILVSLTPTSLVVPPAMAVSSVKELLALAKAKPGTISYASAGNGSINHLTGEMLAMQAKVQLLHVPYKGTGPALNDVMAGQVTSMFVSFPQTLALVKAGRLRTLGVSSSARVPSLPDVPSMAEMGFPDFQSSAGIGLLAPAKTPKAIIDRINAETVKYLNSPDGREKIAGQGAQIIAGTPEEFARLIRDEAARWALVVKAGNIRIE